LAALGCGPHPAPAPAPVPLGGDVAHVGDVDIPASLVADVARSRGVESSRALEGLVQDALLAQEARANGLDRDESAHWATTAVLARIVAGRLLADARRQGAPVEDELATVRVIHAVVLKSPALSPSRAREIASAILQAVVNAKNDYEFESRARGVPHVDARVRIERLPAFDASGRSGDGDVFDADFVGAAFDLHEQGQTGGVVRTPFGWHVIRLMERAVPDAATIEGRRRELAAEVLEMRARTRLRSLLESRRRRTTIEVSAAAEDLMARVAPNVTQGVR
jgi:hypothetical protein